MLYTLFKVDKSLSKNASNMQRVNIKYWRVASLSEISFNKSIMFFCEHNLLIASKFILSEPEKIGNKI